MWRWAGYLSTSTLGTRDFHKYKKNTRDSAHVDVEYRGKEWSMSFFKNQIITMANFIEIGAEVKLWKG